MKELSLNVLDISMNSIEAKATLISILIEEDANRLLIQVVDNGCGMPPEILKTVTDPFCTTRTTRKAGLGIPLFKLAAEQTGGEITILSRHISDFPNEHGTSVQAIFYKQHIDFTPIGDIISTLTTLIQGSPHIDFVFQHQSPDRNVSLDTRELREILGQEIPLNNPEVRNWITQHLDEQYKNI